MRDYDSRGVNAHRRRRVDRGSVIVTMFDATLASFVSFRFRVTCRTHVQQLLFCYIRHVDVLSSNDSLALCGPVALYGVPFRNHL